MYNVSPTAILSMILPLQLYTAHNKIVFLFKKNPRWKNPEIDVYSDPEICQPARKSPGIVFSGNRSLGAPVKTRVDIF